VIVINLEDINVINFYLVVFNVVVDNIKTKINFLKINLKI